MKTKEFDIEVVGKIGSMAMRNREKTAIDEGRLKRLCAELRPGIVWVTSGATEIGRLDFIMRTGGELKSADADENKTDYASQGQAILMDMYRRFIDPAYGVRQLLVEHQHFNDGDKRRHIRGLLLRAARQNCVPIINYNDAVSFEENRKMEIHALKTHGGDIAELVDNDETAARVACLLNARNLVVLTGVDGIYADPHDRSTLISRIEGGTPEQLLRNIDKAKLSCVGASRSGANGAGAKLEYVKAPALQGTRVIIANAAYPLKEILGGNVPCTVIELVKDY